MVVLLAFSPLLTFPPLMLLILFVGNLTLGDLWLHIWHIDWEGHCELASSLLPIFYPF